MAQKKYVSPSKLSVFLDNLKNTFATILHKHTLADITDYTVDSELSSASENPVMNKTIDEEFNAIADAMGALEDAIDGKVSTSDYIVDSELNGTSTNPVQNATITAELNALNDVVSQKIQIISWEEND